MTQTTVSAIVPLRELNELGRRCVERLLALDRELEVIVVSDRPEPGLDSRAVGLVVPGSTAAKRQAGLKRAHGELVALIDDDAYPHPSWLDVAERAFADPTIGAVCGPTLTPGDDSELEQLGGRVFASPLVAGPHRWRYVPLEPRDVDDAPSVNLVVRRTAALDVGFETPVRYGEDTIFCERLRRRGLRIRYEPGAIVFHSRRPLWGPHARQVWRWSRRRGAFARSVGGNSLRPSYFLPSALVAAAASYPLTHGTARQAWWGAAAAYAAACAAAGADRRPANWVRLSLAIALTHAVYGVGFLLGVASVPLPEQRESAS
ncbi:MAG TPA: glycosyltransferase [Gaiellaceae bacterium]